MTDLEFGFANDTFEYRSIKLHQLSQTRFASPQTTSSEVTLLIYIQVWFIDKVNYMDLLHTR